MRQYSVLKKFDFIDLHNDKLRVQGQCTEEFTFYIFASKTKDADSIHIKHFVAEHTYSAHYKSKKCDVNFLAQYYLPYFRDHPTWLVAALKSQVRRDFNIDVPLHCCYRDKQMALERVHGNQVEQFKHTGHYGLTLEKWNPGTSVVFMQVRRYGQLTVV